MSICKLDFDKTKCFYFSIKDEKFLEKYNEIWEKVSNIIKKNLIVSLHIIKKYVKAKKNQHKRRLSVYFYTSNID